MADLASILKDPNYVNANDATKAAIFDKWAPQDPNFANANAETQQAIRVRFGLNAPVVDNKEAVFGKSTAQAEAPLTTGEKIRGAIETPFAVGASLLSGPATYLAGALGPEAQQAVARNIQYQPRTRVARDVLEGMGRAAEGLPPFMPTMGVTNALSNAARPAANALVQEGQLIKGAVTAPLEARAARTAAANVAESVANAPRIEAAQKANQLGIVLNPAVSNPTKGNKIKAVVTGAENVDRKLAVANENRWGELAKEEMGLPADATLDKASFEKARDLASGPYRAVEQVPALAPTPEVGAALNKLRQSEELIGGAKIKASIDALVDDAMAKIGQGMSGDQVIKNIRQMRNEAQDLYKSKKAGAPLTPEEVALADTKMGVANALESLIEANIQDPQALNDFRKARVAMAKTYAYEAATDLNTGKLDPLAIAKITAKDNNLTGTIADIGKIAGNFPDIAKVGPATSAALPTLTRSGLGGTIGYAAGTLVGQPLAGSIAGAALGGLVSAGGAKRIANPAYQLAHAVPTDYRPPVNMLRPANINYGGNQLTPYDFSQATDQPYRPNWVPGQPEVQFPPSAQYAGPAPGPAQLAAPSAESTMAGVAAERARRYNIEKAMAEAPIAQPPTPMGQMANELERRSVNRGRGSIIEIDPVTGKMTIGAEATGGMTPNTQVIESTGAALQSAAQKVTAGKTFDFTAAEKVAWDKTRADLAEVAKGLDKLDDKAIAAKMMDRKWAQEAFDKAREKAQMFDDLAKRIEGEQAKRDAAIKRDQMLDLMQTLEDNLRAPRPTSGGGQGPKTRNFLAQQNKNALRGQ